MLNEMLTDLVFHFTSLRNAENIMKTGRLKLTPSIGTGAEDYLKSGDRVYYISLARSRTADYTVQGAYREGVVFNMNGQYFNRHHRSRAVDYWERMWAHRTKDGRTSEMEDRLFSDKPFIDLDLSKAFSGIHILVKDDLVSFQVMSAINIVKIAKQNNIPVFVYDDKNAFIIQDTRKAMSVTTLVDMYKKSEKKEPYSGRENRGYFDKWLELIFKTDRSQLSKQAKSMTWNMYGMYADDMTRSLSADIHNYKKDETYADQIHKIVSYMKKNGFKTIKELISHLGEKWNPR
jgi:ribosomal protein S15P/S13E